MDTTSPPDAFCMILLLNFARGIRVSAESIHGRSAGHMPRLHTHRVFVVSKIDAFTIVLSSHAFFSMAKTNLVYLS